MSYLGNAPARSFISFERQVFTIVNSQTAYALSHSVTNENDIRLVVNNVVQEPGSGKAYTATGTALTLSAALTNGTDEMYCVFLGRATATNAPGAGSVGTSQLANDAVTLAKMASGTDGNIISYDASGNPVAVATGSAGQILTSAGAGAPPTFAAAGANTPAFLAYANSDQGSIGSDTYTKLTNYGVEVFDTDNKFSSSRFTPGVVGNYFIFGTAYLQNYGAQRSWVAIYKNGSIMVSCADMPDSAQSYTLQVTGMVNVSNTSDYIEIFVRQQGTGTTAYSSGVSVKFGGYKLIS